MQISVNSVESLNSAVYSVPPCIADVSDGDYDGSNTDTLH